MNQFLGILKDERSEEEKRKDWKREEVASAIPIEWKEKTIWKSYPIKRQHYTFECVAQSTTKGLGINHEKETGKYEDLSPGFFYYFRYNKPSGGMTWPDAMKIATSLGSCKTDKIPQRVHEYDKEPLITQEMLDEGKIYRGKAYFALENITMDSIAQTIEEQKYCLLWFWFDEEGKEWWRQYPKIIYPNLGTYDNGTTRHAICGIDYGLKDGKRVIKIEDSAGNNSALNNQDRFIDEEFLKRCFVAGYVIDLVLEPEPPSTPKPKHTFTKYMKLGEKNNDIKMYQDILRYEGLFPKDQNSTGYFGGLTASANEKFQKKYGISPTYRNQAGPKTLTKLKELYS